MVEVRIGDIVVVETMVTGHVPGAVWLQTNCGENMVVDPVNVKLIKEFTRPIVVGDLVIAPAASLTLERKVIELLKVEGVSVALTRTKKGSGFDVCIPIHKLVLVRDNCVL